MKLGIDFGTCYSSAALFLDGTPKAIKEPLSHSFSFPSSVYWSEQGILIGQAAENAKAKNLQNYRNEFKRELGGANPYLLGNSSFLPEELIAEVLKKLKAEADKVVQGRGETSLTAAILTIPATYQPYKRKLMQEAGQKAGFQQIELLEEPVAAALYYSRHARVEEGDIILVYDLGGGTFDATLIQKRGSGYQVLGMPKGLSNCGGIDFDREIYQVLKSQCSESLRQQLERKDAWLARAMISGFCREIKHQLSEEEEAVIYIPLGLGEMESFSLTRQAFNRMVEPLIIETLDCCEQLVRSAGIDWEQVKQILLVGGSCRIP